MLRSYLLATALCLCAAIVQGAPPLVYYDFESNVANQGTGGALYNATTTGGAPTAGWTGGTVGTSTRPGGISGAALSMVRTDAGYLTMPAGTGALGNSFTIGGWYYLSPASVASVRYYPFEASVGYDVSFGTSANGANTSFVSYVGEVNAGTVTGLAAENWHHVVHSFSSNGATTTLSNYIDGTLRSTTNATTASMNFAGINLGNARNGQARYWDGLLDEFGAWNSALSASDVTQLYNRGVLGMPVTGTIVAFDNGAPSANANVNITAVGWAGATQTPIAGANNDLMDAGISGPFFRTQGAGDNTLTLTYTDLDPHSHVNLGMILAQLDSLDPQRDGDRFIVRVDGDTILDAGFGYGTSVNGAFNDVVVTTGDPDLDNELLGLRTIADTNLYGDANFLDNVYDLASLSLFQMIPHTGDTLTLQIIGRQDQPSGEFFGVDNITLELVLIPEPSALAAFGVVGLLIGAALLLCPTLRKRTLAPRR